MTDRQRQPSLVGQVDVLVRTPTVSVATPDRTISSPDAASDATISLFA